MTDYSYSYYQNRNVFEFSTAALSEHSRRCAMTKEAARAEDDSKQKKLRGPLVTAPWVEELLARLSKKNG
jgi:hypothetical protein